MTVEDGIFGIASKGELVAKLRWEFDQLKARHTDRYVAMNFFVTADSLVDWEIPGHGTKERQARADLRDSEPLLLAVEHLANKTKHRKNLLARHSSIDRTDIEATFFGGGFYGSGFFGGGLRITFKGTAAQHFGPSLSAVEFAERVCQWWEGRP